MDIAGVLLERWDLKPTQLEELTGGMNSAVWLAAADGWRVVVEWIRPAVQGALEGAQALDGVSWARLHAFTSEKN